MPNINLLNAFDQARFEYDKQNFISMVNRKNRARKYMKFIDKSKNPFLYVYGTKGIGKYFPNYQLAASLMREDRYIVVYINHASFSIIKDFFETLRIITLTDEESLNSTKTPDGYQTMLGSLKITEDQIERIKKEEPRSAQATLMSDAVLDFMREVNRLYSYNEITLVCIIDQTDALMPDDRKYQKAFCM